MSLLVPVTSAQGCPVSSRTKECKFNSSLFTYSNLFKHVYVPSKIVINVPDADKFALNALAARAMQKY